MARTRVAADLSPSQVRGKGGVVVGLAAALAMGGCVTERTKPGPVRIPEGALSGAPPAASPGRRRVRPGIVPVERATRPADATAYAAAAAAPSQTSAPDAVVRSVPAAQAAPPAHRPLAAGRTLEDVAREKFLEATTNIDAEKATVTVPAGYAAEARLSGTTLKEDDPKRRIAEGVAVLTRRRLTIRARRIVLVARDDGSQDVQIAARGNVVLESDQPASVVKESGLRSLLLTNDGYLPLR
jgi:hypothetical protein